MPDINLQTRSGDVKLSELYSKTPVIMALVFTRCTGICSPFLLQLHDNLRSLDLNNDYTVLVVSFDPTDSLANMQELAQRFKLGENNKWVFAVTPNISAMNEAIDFHPVWDSARKQFDHEALLVGLNENGYIAKKLLGMRDRHALNTLIKEINNEFVISYPLPNENSTFTCFTYDPATGKRKVSSGMLVLLLPAAITLLLLIWLGFKKPTAA